MLLSKALCLQISHISQSETRTAKETADKHCHWLSSTVEALLLADFQCLLHTFELDDRSSERPTSPVLSRLSAGKNLKVIEWFNIWINILKFVECYHHRSNQSENWTRWNQWKLTPYSNLPGHINVHRWDPNHPSDTGSQEKWISCELIIVMMTSPFIILAMH